jgi:hypothetical protein
MSDNTVRERFEVVVATFCNMCCWCRCRNGISSHKDSVDTVSSVFTLMAMQPQSVEAGVTCVQGRA